MKIEFSLSVKRSESVVEDFYSLLSSTISSPNWVWSPTVYNQHPLNFQKVIQTQDSIIFEFDSTPTIETIDHIRNLICIGMNWYMMSVQLDDIVYKY